jgi:peptidoglycan/LPS O-acetylase OafA/YrhL
MMQEAPAQTPSHGNRIPEVDGLRALAVAFVIVSHAFPKAAPNGGTGVDIFFVISGFVITRSLLFDARENGAISLYSFYLRRIFRILPALWVMAIATAIVAAFLKQPEWGEALATLSSTMNWVRAFQLLPGGGALGHAWSLSIEEQFYLVWPVTLIFLLRAPPGLRWALLCLGLPAITLWRFVLIAHGADIDRIYNGLDTHADGLLLGCIMALWAKPPPRLLAQLWFVPLAILLVSVFLETPPGAFVIGTRYLWLALLSGWLIWAAAGPETFLHPILRSPPAQWGGTRSYSLYLWHYPIVYFLIPSGLGTAAKAGIEIGGALVAAELSYRLIELPALRARPRFDAFARRLFGKAGKVSVPAGRGAEDLAN